GLMMAHPESRYFAIGTIGQDQVADYARRRGVPTENIYKYLTKNMASL
ncbi:MAG: 5-methyltetrahydrofolate--homocysteine methyltransferase, partial [Bacteroidaceae bacterium]|nr:5-methyltetrahydrofolate--homocysteine methyltransferase [Bacteroidaceae bacterium]